MKPKEIIITSQDIKELIEGITNMNLSNKRRYRNMVNYRMVAFKLSRELTFDSTSYIGRLYKRDHSTVIHGLSQFEKLKNQHNFKDALKLYNRCYDILVPIPEKFKHLKREKEVETVIKFVHKKELTPIQKLVDNLTPEQEKELTQLITLRKKSWEWKSKDTLKVYSGSY